MQFAWVTRSGRATLVDAEWTFNPGRDNRSWDISPDGSRLALKALTDLGSDIWVKTLPDGPIARFTFDPAEERMPRWSPDGRSLLFISPRNGNLDVWSRRTDGFGDAVLVADLEQSIADVVWSPDGQWLIMRTAGAAGVVGNRDLYIMRVGGDTIPRKLLAAGADEASPAFSPDGRWLAYHSEETGRREVFVRPFPNVEAGQFQVSAGGGRAPVWSNRGDELFYVADGNGENATSRRLMVATIDLDPTFQVMRRQVLFPIEDNYYLANNTTSYRIASDDERFLMARYVGESARVELVLVQNFFEELRENVAR
jgi:serine/threonine-protein kinase